MNPLLAGVGGVCAALAGVELLSLLARPGAVTAMAAVVAPASGVAGRGRGATRQGRHLLSALAAAACLFVLALAGHLWIGLAAAAGAPGLSSLLIRLRLACWRSAMRRGAAAAALAIGEASASGLPGVASIERAAGDGALTSVVATELGDLAVRCRLGLPLEDGLDELRRRTACGPWDSIVAAILVQRAVGGELSRILSGLASGLDDEERSHAEARSLSSQARLTARIVIAMPVAGVALAELASPGTIGRIVSTPLPRALAVVAAVLQLAALVTVRRVARLTGGQP